MNWSKAKSTLSSIHRLIAIFEEADDLSTIERDLLLKRIQELYEVVLLSETDEEKQEKQKTPISKQPTPTPVIETAKIEPPKVEQKIERAKPQPVAPPPVIQAPKPQPTIAEQPKPKLQPVVIETPKPIKIEKPKVEEKPIYTEPVRKEQAKVVADKPISNQNTSEEIIELFEFKSATDLSEKLSDSPIKDLKASMSINERFLTISELFKGNAARYNEVLEVLNGLSTFEQAKSYLIRVVIPEFDWTAEKKQGLAKRFIKKVNRRFL